MYRRLIGGVKRAFGLHKPGRDLPVFPDDTFVVSYPKSGNTWTRFLIANLVYPEKLPDFRNINYLLPMIQMNSYNVEYETIEYNGGREYKHV